MHNSTEAEIKRVVLDILDHSKPSTCERCKYAEKCFEGTFKETIHNFEHCGTGPVWDKEAELDRIDRVIAYEGDERDELKNNLMDSKQKAYAMGWVDGRNGKPPVLKEVITPKDAIVPIDDMYVTVSQLISMYHDVKDEYKAAAHKLDKIRKWLLIMSKRDGSAPEFEERTEKNNKLYRRL